MFRANKEAQLASRPLADRLEDAEDADSIEELEPRSRRRRCLASRWFKLSCYGVLFVVSHLVASQIGALLAISSIDVDRECAAHTTQWSPVLADVPIRYEWKRFNGSFLQEDIYRQVASPEVDAAWEALGVDYRAGVIPAAAGAPSGLTSAHVQVADQYGGGFFVNVEGMHHLHCLNLVRKGLYYNYQYYKDMGKHAFSNDEPILRLHVSHCLDIIRQVLMCNVDTGVLGQLWYDPAAPKAFPDFHTTHRCKNYDDVRQWADKLQAPPPNTLPTDFLKQPDPKDVWQYTP